MVGLEEWWAGQGFVPATEKANSAGAKLYATGAVGSVGSASSFEWIVL